MVPCSISGEPVDFEVVRSRLSVDQGTANELVRIGAMVPEDSQNLTAVYGMSRIFMSLISEIYVEMRVVKLTQKATP